MLSISEHEQYWYFYWFENLSVESLNDIISDSIADGNSQTTEVFCIILALKQLRSK